VGDRLHLPNGAAIAVSRNEPDFVRPGNTFGAPLGDPFVSRRPIHFGAIAGGGVRLVVADGGTPVTAGAPVRGAVELDASDLANGVALELAGRVTLLLHRSPVAEAADDAFGMVGYGDGIARVRRSIARVVDLAVPVLVRGETGTGKELVARAIHERSARRTGPFVSVNLGAIPKELAAAELFGATKGAYTGAVRDRDGFFRAARGGTLFLDEVGEAPAEVQAMLLRVLETGEMYAVGGPSKVATDVRLIAATDADLDAHIRDGRFKAPLLHRLAGYQVRLPPLRERRDDIGVLFHHFAREELAAIGETARLAPVDPYADPWLPASLAAMLVRAGWPGNIRQLRNVARQVVIACRGKPQIRIDPQLAEELAIGRPIDARAVPRAADAPATPRKRPADVSDTELLEALRDHAWDLQAAADQLGIPRSSMYRRIERSPGIRTAGDLTADEIVRCFRECGGDLGVMGGRLSVSARALKRRVRELGLVPSPTAGRAPPVTKDD